MSAILPNENGNIRYSDDFIASIVGMSATECYGVVGMTATKAWDNVADFLGKNNFKKGVKIVTDESNCLSIELNIVVEYGMSISVVCQSIMQTVKYNVEKITGLTVREVNIIVSGIRVQ